jgi:hypothetical protein
MKRFLKISTALFIAASILQFGPGVIAPETRGFVGAAEARVGRPATPVSVAGAGRRTVRRCAAGVYHC